MSEANPRTESLFWSALAISSPEERARYLEQACGGDAQLRGRLEELLAAYPRIEGFLEPPACGPFPTVDEPPRGEHPGAVIGSYKLVERLGEGGMGEVWMAQQTDPVKRLVALKLIKAGMDSKQVIARFEAERQALALMDHANIARVLDAGTTGAGRPYFVMDLVKGVPITRYCDEHHLTPRQRLELFIPVCQAVQHAHHKGIIHRDIKPSNVLVALHDGKPVPKVIDFGVAKAAGPTLTEKTLVTGFGNIVGTLEYMSPEQAEINQLDIDTRSDIYSLGVLLYELLAGSPPFTRKEHEKGGMLEMLRVIREQEPTKPSAKLSTAEGLPTLAANRGTEPAKLTRLVRGELDWIVMKALEKDRSRRYETANGFAMDVQRYLADEPVVAGPPSAGYRLRKFVKRNKVQVVAACLVLLALVVGMLGATWGLVHAEEARDKAETQRNKALAAEELAGARLLLVQAEQKRTLTEWQRAEANAKIANEEWRIAYSVRQFLHKWLLLRGDASTLPNTELRAGGFAAVANHDVTVRELLDRAAAQLTQARLEEYFPGQPRLQAEILHTVGASYRTVGEPSVAVALLERAVALSRRHLDTDHPDALNALHNLAGAYWAADRLPEAIRLFEQVKEIREKKKRAADHPDALATLNDLAGAYVDAGKLTEAIRLFEQVRQAREAKPGPNHPDTLRTLNGLALAYQAAGKQSEAILLLEQARQAWEQLGADGHTTSLATLNNLGVAYTRAGKQVEAIHLLEQVKQTCEEKRGAHHPVTLIALHNLALAHRDAGRSREAIRLLTQASEALQKKLGPDHVATLISLHSLALTYQTAGRLTEAIRLFEQVNRALQEKRGADHRYTLSTLQHLARACRAAGKFPEAVRLLEQVKEAQEKKRGADHPETLSALHDLARTYRAAGKLAEAVRLFEQVKEAREKKLGADHPDTLDTLHSLAVAYRDADKLPDAVRLFEQVKEAREKKLGADHPDTLNTRKNLALAYTYVGKAALAIRLLEEVKATRERTLEADHPDTLATLNDLAQALHAAGKWTEAIRLFERVKEVREKTLEADHPETLKTINDLAVAYLQAGKGTQALHLLEQVKEVWEKKLGADHPDTLGMLDSLAGACRATGKIPEAIRLYEQVRQARERKLGADHRQTLLTLNNLAAAHWTAKQLDRSIPLFEDLLKRSEAKLGRDHPNRLRIMANLGINYRDAGRLDEALPLLEEAHRKGKPHAALAWVEAQLMAAYVKADKPSAAATLLRDSLAGTRKRLPVGGLQLAAELAKAAHWFLQLKQDAEAEPLLRECLTIREQQEADAWTTFNTQSMLGGALVNQKKYDDAAPLLLKGYEGLKRHAARMPPQVKDLRLREALERLVQLYEGRADPEQANAWRQRLEAHRRAEKKASK